MGSMAYWIGRGKQPLAVDREQCNACGRCARVCPMELYPGAHREEGVMTHGDCLKCSSCVVACPRQALSFEKVPHSDEPDCVAVNQSEAS
ncbi:MAG: Ferredoxin-2 [bacterium ADurb.Bin429]|nr:MAG: Ferredoxin-2 [bacterium ADurb.Bin429]